MIRKAQFAGRFYPEQASNIEQLIRDCFLSDVGPQILPSEVKTESKLTALICPHAGYLYSGPIAAWAYLEAAKRDVKPDTVVLIGPNHTGVGSSIALSPKGQWQTPLGSLAINEELSKKIAADADGIDLDAEAHEYEHSIEVQLPFLQFVYGSDFQIVCISMINQAIEIVKKLSDNLSEAIKDQNILLVCTSDLSHYLPINVANQKDISLLKAFQSKNIDLVYSEAEKLHASACGLAPASIALQVGSNLGAQRIDLLKYETSAASTGDNSTVVGYAALSIS